MAEINNVIAEASQDLQTIEDFVNLPAGSDVRPRLLPSVNVGTLAGARQAIFEAGGLPATPFATKALMTASALANGKYAMVTDGGADNGLYVKTAGAWVKSAYDPSAQALAQSLNVFKIIPDMLASNPSVGTQALVTQSSIENENNYYEFTATGWKEQSYNPPAKAKALVAEAAINYYRKTNYDKVKFNLKNSVKFDLLTDTEKTVFDFVKDLELQGDYEGELFLNIIHSNNTLQDIFLIDANSVRLPLMPSAAANTVVSDNGTVRELIFKQSYPDGKAIHGSIVYDYSAKSYSVYSYSKAPLNPNLIFKSSGIAHGGDFSSAFSVMQDGAVTLHANSSSLLSQNSIYAEIDITSQMVLGSVSVEILGVPVSQPSWVECCIYPQDNGFETAKRITSSDQVPIYKKGVMRLALEQKMLPAGRYIIGFKTNAPSVFATHMGDGKYWKIYDEAGLPMAAVAPPIRVPAILDGVAAFPAFSLHSHKRIAQPIFPQDWHLEYRPQYKLLGVLDDNLYYIYSEEYHGRQKTTLSISTDGGKTITAISDEIPSSNELFNYIREKATARSAIVKNTDNSLDFYLPLSLGGIAKVTLNTDKSITAENITPPLSSKQGKDSYAPAIHWKGYIWYGEYGDPELPKIHKYDLETSTWSVSIQKPNSGKTGARHLHYLYVSPSNPDIMWAVWGDVHGGGGQGLSRLKITEAKASAQLDSWVQWSTGVHDKTLNTTFPYPTGLIEIYEPKNGLLGSDEAVLIGAGDQPPTHLITINTNEANAGKALFHPLSFKRESAPMTETCHWLTMDDEKTIYYLTAESYPVVSVYASPYPYTETFQLTQYWQAARAGCIEYNKGYINCTYFRFPKVKFRNILDNPEISKIPYLPAAKVGEDMVVHYNRLLDYLRRANMMQTFYEQGSDKSAAHPWVDFDFDSESRWSNWGQK